MTKTKLEIVYPQVKRRVMKQKKAGVWSQKFRFASPCQPKHWDFSILALRTVRVGRAKRGT